MDLKHVLFAEDTEPEGFDWKDRFIDDVYELDEDELVGIVEPIGGGIW